MNVVLIAPLVRAAVDGRDSLLARPRIPAGSASAPVEAYYRYLYARYFEAMPVPHTQISWAGPLWVALWGVVLIGFFYLYAHGFSRVHRKRGALYGVSSFAGAILERIGPVSRLTKAVWIVVALWALYYAVADAARGYLY